jgi:hypothetical protein
MRAYVLLFVAFMGPHFVDVLGAASTRILWTWQLPAYLHFLHWLLLAAMRMTLGIFLLSQQRTCFPLGFSVVGVAWSVCGQAMWSMWQLALHVRERLIILQSFNHAHANVDVESMISSRLLPLQGVLVSIATFVLSSIVLRLFGIHWSRLVCASIHIFTFQYLIQNICGDALNNTLVFVGLSWFLEGREVFGKKVFASMRFGDRRSPVAMTKKLAKVLQELYGIKLQIIDTSCGARAFDKVFSTMAKCDAFMVMGTSGYGKPKGIDGCN